MATDLKITDFQTYPWKTLCFNPGFNCTYNIQPKQHVEGDLFDTTIQKVVSIYKCYQIIGRCDPYVPPYYARKYTDGVYSSWLEISEDDFWRLLCGYITHIKFPPLCTSHYYF